MLFNFFVLLIYAYAVIILVTEMTATNSGNLLTADEAHLLTSLVFSGSDRAMLHRTLVTIGNKAAFTSNQVVSVIIITPIHLHNLLCFLFSSFFES